MRSESLCADECPSKRHCRRYTFGICDGITLHLVDSTAFPLADALVETEEPIVYCFGQHEHKNAFRGPSMPQPHYKNNSTCVDPNTLSQLINYAQLSAEDIRVDHLLFLSKYFCCKDNVTDIVRNESRFLSPLTTLTHSMTFGNHLFTDNASMSAEVLMLEQFPLMNRLECVNEHLSDPFALMKRNAQHELLLPSELKELLHSTRAVVAGGAASLLVQEEITQNIWPSSDIDIFVLNNNDAEKTLVKMLTVCRGMKDAILIKTSKSVVTLVRSHSLPNIQFIMSSNTSLDVLLAGFDLNFNRVAFDGNYCHIMACAYYELLTKKCMNGVGVIVGPKRIAKAMLKGFELNDDAISLLSNTIGYPLPNKIINQLKFERHYFSPEVPLEIELAKFAACGATYCSEDVTLEKLADSAYNIKYGNGEMGVCTQPMDVYLNSFTATPINHKNLTVLNPTMLWKLPVCSYPFQIDDIFTPSHFSTDLKYMRFNKLQFRYKSDHTEWQLFMVKLCKKYYKSHDDLIKHVLSSTIKRRSGNSYSYDMVVKVDTLTKVYYRGIRITTLPESHKCRTNVKIYATGYPRYITCTCITFYITSLMFV